MQRDQKWSNFVKQLQIVDQQLRLGLRSSRPPSNAVALVGRAFDISSTVCGIP